MFDSQSEPYVLSDVPFEAVTPMEVLRKKNRKITDRYANILDACFRLRTISKCLETAENIMLMKPVQPVEQVQYYVPISRLPVIS